MALPIQFHRQPPEIGFAQLNLNSCVSPLGALIGTVLVGVYLSAPCQKPPRSG